jgi:putative membrane protein
MFKTRLILVVPSLLAVHALGCGGGDQPANSPANPPTPVETSQATTTGPVVSPGTSSSSPAPTSSAPPPASTPVASSAGAVAPASDAAQALTDEQILEVTHTANQGEIDQAKLAQSRSKDARVTKLAAMMLKDHTAADAKGMAVGRKGNLTPAPSSTSTSIESDAQSATSTLTSQTGVDFDKAYVDTQVKEHQAVLDLIDQKLLPDAKNPDVKAFLTEVRPKIAMHLRHAQELQSALQKQAAAKLTVSGTN